MPTAAFKTRKGEPPVEIPGVGIVDDQDGVPLERAAERMRELHDEHGAPLTGRALLKAAEAWVEKVAHHGIQLFTGDDAAKTSTGSKRRSRPRAKKKQETASSAASQTSPPEGETTPGTSSDDAPPSAPDHQE